MVCSLQSCRQIQLTTNTDAVEATTLPRRASTRIAQSQANSPASRTLIEVAIPTTSSRSSVVDDPSDETGTNQYSTPATSVAITPAEPEPKRPGNGRKRVNASTRARELRSSTMHLGNDGGGGSSTRGGRGQKRNAPEISKTDLDEALARALQAEEYNGGNKRQKVVAGSDDEDDEDDDDYGEDEEDLSSMDSLPTTPASSDDELAQADESVQPRRKRQSRTGSQRTTKAKGNQPKRFNMKDKPAWMSNRVGFPLYWVLNRH